MVSIPSPHLAEKNPDAYNHALAALPRVVSGMGTCACCGTAIVNVFLVRNSGGELYGVGCNCIEKSGEAPLIRATVAAKRAADRAKRAAKAEAIAAERRAAWEAGREAREAASAKAAAEQAARRQGNALRFAWVLAVLQNQSGDFCRSMAEQILQFGALPRGRAGEIVREIFGKATGGRMGSAAFYSAVENFDRLAGCN
jgi:hypothetical protein